MFWIPPIGRKFAIALIHIAAFVAAELRIHRRNLNETTSFLLVTSSMLGTSWSQSMGQPSGQLGLSEVLSTIRQLRKWQWCGPLLQRFLRPLELFFHGLGGLKIVTIFV